MTIMGGRSPPASPARALADLVAEASTDTASTVPSKGAVSACSIFMASRVTSGLALGHRVAGLDREAGDLAGHGRADGAVAGRAGLVGGGRVGGEDEGLAGLEDHDLVVRR